jgi:hypothetical protein
LSLPAVRMAKQAGRDRAARKILKGKFTKSKFDHTKSTAAKADFRLAQVKHLIKMIVDLAYKDPEKDVDDFKRVKKYLTASGVDRKRLYRQVHNPQKALELLVSAIKEREFI